MWYREKDSPVRTDDQLNKPSMDGDEDGVRVHEHENQGNQAPQAAQQRGGWGGGGKGILTTTAASASWPAG